jgi:hypothetical protein
VNVLNNDYIYENKLGTISFFCRSLLHSNVNYYIDFARWHANRVVHNLARISLFQSNSIVHYYYSFNILSFLLFLKKCNDLVVLQTKKINTLTTIIFIKIYYFILLKSVMWTLITITLLYYSFINFIKKIYHICTFLFQNNCHI